MPRLINEANLVPERLVSLRSRLSAAYKGVYALQMKNGAADWITGKPLTIATYDNEPIDIHHIFPVAWCNGKANPSIPKRLYDSVINKTPIDATTNKIIGGNAPSKYLPLIQQILSMTPDKLNEVLRAHWLDVNLLNSDDFAKSFVERGEAMLKLIGNAMGRELASGRDVFLNALGSAGYSDLYVEDEDEIDDTSEDADMDDVNTTAA